MDFRYALRQILRAPGFFAAAVLVLALGIGASVTVFAFFNAALVKPLPYRNPSRLVAVSGRTSSCRDCSLSYPDYQDFVRSNSVFRSLEIWQPTSYLWRHSGGVEALRAGRVSGGFFNTLGVSPLIGRVFSAADDAPAAPRTVVLPYATWQRDFAGRADVLGQSITLDNDAYAVIGVLPEDFEFAPRSAELWVTTHDLDPCSRDRSCRGFSSLARLNDGVSITAALANLSAVARQLEKQYPQSNAGQGVSIVSLATYVTGDLKPILLVLLAGSALLFLVSCVNLAGLLLVRAEHRRREMAVRNALGGSVARLTRQLAIEAGLLVVLACSCGLPLAWAVMRLLASWIPERVLRGMPYFASIQLDWRVALFALALACLAWVIAVAAPASRIYVGDLRTRLAEGSRGAAGHRSRFGAHLVVVELALAIVLLVAAGILGKSFYRVMQVDLNFNPDHLATLEIDANSGYETPVAQRALARQVLNGLEAYPGVTSAALVTSQLPVTCNCDTGSYRVQGRPWSETQQLALARTVSPGYLETLEGRLFSGRFFNENDDESHTPVVVINRTMAREFFHGEDPLGQTIGDETLSPASLHQVIGVVDDIREGQLNAPIFPAAYFALKQNPTNYLMLMVRTAQSSAVAEPGIVAAVHGLNPAIGLRNEFTMTEHLHHGAAYYVHSSTAWLAAGFAGCALILGVIGLYGVIAYSVSQRTREMGIRMALGAQRSSIRRLILWEASSLVLFGLLFGISASLLTTRFLRTLLFGVHAWDFSVLAVVTLVFAAAAMVAAWIPADRAASADPAHALRGD